MKNNICFFLLLLSLTIIGCDQKRVRLINDDIKVYEVQHPDLKSYFQWDEFVEKVELIPLETIEQSLIATFTNGIVSQNHIENLKTSKNFMDYFNTMAFKEIYPIFNTNDKIYYRCIGPDSYKYEGFINKKENEATLGRWDFRRSPTFFFADKNLLYGYYEPSTLIENSNNGESVNVCFANLKDKVQNMNIEDNVILVKVYLK